MIHDRVDIKSESKKIKEKLSDSLQMIKRSENPQINIPEQCTICNQANPPGKNPNSLTLQCDKCGNFNHIVCFNKEHKTKKSRNTINFLCSACHVLSDHIPSTRPPPGFPFTPLRSSQYQDSSQNIQPTGSQYDVIQFQHKSIQFSEENTPSSPTQSFQPLGTMQSSVGINFHPYGTLQPSALSSETPAFHPSGTVVSSLQSSRSSHNSLETVNSLPALSQPPLKH